MVFLSSEFLIISLIFIILFYFTYKTTFKLLKNNKVAYIIGISASLLAIYYITYNELKFTFITFGYTGVIVLMLIPTIIVFFIIYRSNISSVLRKVFWIIYGIMTILILQNYNLIPKQDYNTNIITIIIIIIIIVIFDNLIKDKVNLKINLGGT